MKNGKSFQPVLMELVIVTLFLSLSLSVIVRVLGAAGTWSRAGAFETRALLLLEDTMERTKADPAGDGALIDGVWHITPAEIDGIAIEGTVRATAYGAGVYYEIELQAHGTGDPVTLSGARYVPQGRKEVSAP